MDELHDALAEMLPTISCVADVTAIDTDTFGLVLTDGVRVLVTLADIG